MELPTDNSPLPSDPVRVASSTESDTRLAIRDVLDRVAAAEAAFTFVFFSAAHDHAVLADELRRAIGDRGIAGSSAGELTPDGCTAGGIVALALHAPGARAAIRVLPDFADFSLVRASGLSTELARSLHLDPDELDPTRHSWVLLLDGLSRREELFTPFFATHSAQLPLVGGSLGDDNRYEATTLIFDGEVLHGASAAILLEYDRPFELISDTHVEFTDEWFEVDEVRQGGRAIVALDGKPAVVAYAERLGLAPDEVDDFITASNPLGYRFRGRPFPCSVAVLEDRSGIAISQAVQPGEKLALLRSSDLIGKSRSAIERAMQNVTARGGKPQGILLFSCVMRHLEAQYLDISDELGRVMTPIPVAGFQTYGEQFGSRHVSHSLCGIMFG